MVKQNTFHRYKARANHLRGLAQTQRINLNDLASVFTEKPMNLPQSNAYICPCVVIFERAFCGLCDIEATARAVEL